MSQIFPIFIFQVYFSDLYLHACKTLKPGFFWYAVDTNLFRLGSTNPKKKFQTLVLFFRIIFFKNVQIFLNKPFCFFSKVFKFKGPVPRNDKQIPSPSVLIPLSWKMRNWLNRIRKILRKILRFLFFELSWKIHHKLGWWRYKNDQKMTITRKMKIGKIWYMVFFFLFSRFRIFHVNFINFEKKNDFDVTW